MSGFEIIGLISSIASIVEASIKIYKAAGNATGLPPSFRGVITRLPLIQDSLNLASDGLDRSVVADESYGNLKSVLEACEARIVTLHDIFKTVIPPAEATRTTKHWMMLKALSKSDEVKDIMEGIMADMQILTVIHTIKLATRAQIWEIMTECREQDINWEASNTIIHNSGSGRQWNHSGNGNQNMSSNGGIQVNGASHGSTFNFSKR